MRELDEENGSFLLLPSWQDEQMEMEGPACGRLNLERMPHTVVDEGWPSLICQVEVETRGLKIAVGSVLLMWCFERWKGYSPFSVCLRKRVLPDVLFFTIKPLASKQK